MSHSNDLPLQRMMQMITGYWVTQIVGAVAAFGIVDRIDAGANDAESIARACGTEPRATLRLLRAAASLGLLAPSDGGYCVTPLGATLGSGAGSMRGMAIAQAAPGHWLPWGRFRDAVQSGTRQTPAALGAEIFDYYGAHPEEAAAFSGAMEGLSTMVTRDVVDNLDTRSASRVVDVGGANGTLLAGLLAANPSLSGVLLELPHVVPAAKAKLASFDGRCEILAGDFFASVPDGDLYLLKLDRSGPCLALLRALPPIELRPRVGRGGRARTHARSELDDVSVRIAEVDRANRPVIRDAARVDARASPLLEHRVERRVVHFERDVQIEVVLLLELERPLRHFEEREARAVAHRVERVERARRAPRLRRRQLDRRHERKAEELLVEAPRLFRIAAAVRAVVQAFDHRLKSTNRSLARTRSSARPRRPPSSSSPLAPATR
jgi:hypothetical protein